MKIIKSKLSKINSYLNNYLHDTLDLVKPFKKIKSDKDYISQIIVLLQVIYTQQDLIDELLHIFKLQNSKKEDKNPNRDIRKKGTGNFYYLGK